MQTWKGWLAAGLFLLAGWVQAMEVLPYSAAALATLQEAGKPAALHFHADWCPTCRKQRASFNWMRDEKEFEQLTLLVVDYDNEKALREQLGVRSQSTVIVYRGDKETARANGETSVSTLRKMLKTAL